MEVIYESSDTARLYDRYHDFDLVIDSRRVRRPAKTLFFALPGRARHGVSFLEALTRVGVSHFVVPIDQREVARPRVQSLDEDHRVIFAIDPVEVLQALAAHHRAKFAIPVVGVTGSNGKTMVKDWLTQLLKRKFRVCASPRSFNSQIGVPLSVWQLDGSHEVAVFEAGVSRVGEMEKLAAIIQPTIGLMTNLGAAHDEGFSSRAEKLREKIRLFQSCQFVGVRSADKLIRQAIRPCLDLGWEGHGRTSVTVDGRKLELDLPDLPSIYLENAYAAVTIAYWLGVPTEDLIEGSRAFTPLENRLQQTHGLHGGPVINDSYSNDLDALAAAIAFASQQSPTGRIQLILGTVQSGNRNPLPGTRDSALDQLLDERIESMILVGNKTEPGESLRITGRYENTEDLLMALPGLSFNTLPILVKGASHERLDRVAKALSKHQHRTNLRIDLGAIQHNFRTYRKRVKGQMIVMVKASAYGGGSLPIARAMEEAGADYLAVAYVDEGRELRRGGVGLPIMVLNPETEEFAEMLEWRLEPVVSSTNGLRRAGELGLAVHWELDTGMARLGMVADEAEDAIHSVPKMPKVKSIFSHLVASEAPEHDAFTTGQGTLFAEAAKRIVDKLGYAPTLHLLNSNGIARWPDLQFGAVRLGIGLYGIGDATLAGQLRPALRLTTRISLLSNRPAGTTIGYNRKGLLTRESQIATLSIGYADGLPRLAGEGNFSVWIDGQRAPTVGAICMDMTMVDVTDLDSNHLREGQEVVIFGPELPIEELAAAAQTIPYEILTGVGPRVHRIYVRE